MKQRLLTLAAVLSALGAGSVVFMRWETGETDDVLENAGLWEVVDRSTCSTAACNNAQCTAALAALQDGSSTCVPRFVDCDFRITQRVRDIATAGGVALSAAKYQRLRMVALRCPGADGGTVFGVPFNDAGVPVYAVATQTPLCLRAPLDGGTTCLRSLPDGGTRFFGAGNVFPASEAAGSNCEPVGCLVVFGDHPDTDLAP